MRKSYTDRSVNFNNYKYPIISKTGHTYEVRIKPYREDDTCYTTGCIASLYKKSIFSKKLIERHFENENGKVSISYWSGENVQTEFEYNMIEMTRLIVQLYESKEKLNDESVLQIEKDFEDFRNWDGKC